MMVSGSLFAQVSRSNAVKNNHAFVYHGKLVRPDGTTPSGSMAVTLKILSPDPGLCVLWVESQTVHVSNGGFSIEIGHSVNRASGSTGGAATDFKQAFVNNPGLTISSAQCATGNSYTPTTSDDRLLTATFNDSGNVIDIAGLPVKSVPFAIEAQQLGGYGLSNLTKISGAGSNVVYSPDEVQTLKDLLGGDVFFDMKSREVKNVASPVGASDAANKAYVDNAITGAIVSAGAGTVTNITVSGGVLGITNGSTTPQISLAVASTSTSGYLSSTDWNTFNGKQAALGFTPVSNSLPTGQVLVGDGSNVAAGRNLLITDVKSSTTGNFWQGGVCTAGQMLTYETPADRIVCAAYSLASNSVGTANLSDKSVTFAKMQDIATAKLLGRSSSGTGSAEELSLGPGLALSGGVLNTTNSGTVTGVVVGGSPLSVSGTTTPTISIAVASSSTSGYLTAADWNTFNSKPSAGDNLGNHTATSNLNLGSNLLVGNGGSFGLAITAGGNVGIGTTSPGTKLDVAGTINATAMTINGVPVSSGGGVTSVSSANGDISVANGSTTPSFTLNAGTSGGAGDANKIAKLDASGLLSANMIPNHSATKITSGTLAVAQGGTGSSAALNNNRLMISSGGNIVENSAITGNRAVISNASGIPIASAVTDTELGYMSGVTSSVQTQLNAKQSSNTEVTGLAGIALTGILQRTGAGSYTALGTTSPLTVSGGNIAMTYTPVNKGGDTMTGMLNLASNGLAVGTNQLVVNGGNVGIGVASPAQKLSVAGTIESTSGGIKFPDGSVQTTAATSGSKPYQFGTPYTADTSTIGVVGNVIYDSGQSWWVVQTSSGIWTTYDFDHYTQRAAYTSSSSLRYNAGIYFVENAYDIYSSSDGGATWALKLNCSGTYGCGDLEYIQTSNTLVTIPYGSGLKTYYTSTDNGTSWTSRTFPTASTQLKGIGPDRIFIVPYTMGLQTSTDGITWTNITLPGGITVSDIENVGYAGGKWLLPATNSRVLVSDDGINWSIVNLPAPGMDYILGFYGGKMIAAGGKTLYSSTDGTTWNREILGLPDRFSKLVFQGGHYIGIGSSIMLFK